MRITMTDTVEMRKPARGRANQRWTAKDVPDQQGRTVVVTGANGGLGFEAARVLAERGATVVLACRNPERADEAAARIEAANPGASVRTLRLDLASLASVREAADRLRSDHARLDLLINNAGVMATARGRTADGFELQLGTNHLGPFAFTGLVMDRLLSTPGSRVVTVSSTGHRIGAFDFSDLELKQGYRRFTAYGRSKLANLLFTYELQRRLEANGADTIALAAHPGTSRTDLSRHLGGATRFMTWMFEHVIGQDAPMGALPALRAAVDPEAAGGEYYGPGGLLQMRGFPRVVQSSAASHDRETQRRLWAESERLTGVTFPV
jgi:NAD(P)-dependent dehydrogenase (short-subunit alcohol dehydrogenase family)